MYLIGAFCVGERFSVRAACSFACHANIQEPQASPSHILHTEYLPCYRKEHRIFILGWLNLSGFDRS